MPRTLGTFPTAARPTYLAGRALQLAARTEGSRVALLHSGGPGAGRLSLRSLEAAARRQHVTELAEAGAPDYRGRGNQYRRARC
jgi:hypothetical protein